MTSMTVGAASALEALAQDGALFFSMLTYGLDSGRAYSGGGDTVAHVISLVGSDQADAAVQLIGG